LTEEKLIVAEGLSRRTAEERVKLRAVEVYLDRYFEEKSFRCAKVQKLS
jgi:hypothetical protein